MSARFGSAASMAALLTLATVASALPQSSGQRHRTSGNAATVYKDAFALFDKGVPAGISADEWDEVMELTGRGRLSPRDLDRVRGILQRADVVKDALLPAGSMSRCDWDLDRSKGFDLALPHLSSMRAASRFLTAEAALGIAESDWGASLDAIQSLASLANHAGQDSVLISSLVGAAIGTQSLGPIDAKIDEGTLTQESARELAEALKPLRGDDPFRYGGATRGEFSLLSSTVKGHTGAEIAALVGDGADDGLKDMSAGEVRRELAGAKGIYERAAKAMENPDPVAARKEIAAIQAEADKNSVLMQVLMPAFDRVLESKIRFQEQFDERMARIEAIAAGKKTAQELANASTWFRRAAAVAMGLNEESQEALEVVRVGGKDADPALRERADRVLLGPGQVIREYITKGLAAGRVDLDLPDDGDLGVGARWLPGLRAACRVMQTRAMVADTAECAAITAQLLGVVRDLAADPSVVRCLVARSIADETIPLINRLAAATDLKQEARDSVMHESALLGELPVFGLTKATDADRERIAIYTGRENGLITDQKKVLGRRGGDFVLFVQVTLGSPAPLKKDADAALSADAAAPPDPGPMLRFNDILPPEALKEALSRRPALLAAPFFSGGRSLSRRNSAPPRSAPENPFKGVEVVQIRSVDADTAVAGETVTKLGEAIGRLGKS